MTAVTTAEPARAIVQPHSRRTALRVGLAATAALLPVYLSTLIVRPEHALTSPLAITSAVLLVAALVAGDRVARRRIVLTDDGLIVTGLLRTRTIPMAAISGGVVLPLYDNDSLTSRNQLILLDSRGRTLLRIGSRYWPETGMGDLVTHLDVPIAVELEPRTRKELRLERPLQVTGLERHPGFTSLAVIVGTIAGAWLLAALAVGSIA